MTVRTSFATAAIVNIAGVYCMESGVYENDISTCDKSLLI